MTKITTTMTATRTTMMTSLFDTTTNLGLTHFCQSVGVDFNDYNSNKQDEDYNGDDQNVDYNDDNDNNDNKTTTTMRLQQW